MPPRPSTASHRQTLLREAIQVMQIDYASDLGVDDIARRIATSRRQLQRCFAEHSGESFRECLTGIRMDRAVALLAADRSPIRQVAAQVGYRQPAQFAKAFRRRYGVSPSAYRASASAGTRRAGSRPQAPSAGRHKSTV
jgi:AraC family transcriptional regulator, regulatory protein of adaptative response / methylphosphotriester-DNA alkyltransferase methyltransferase